MISELDWSDFYRSRRFDADPFAPVDRWFQLPSSGNVASLAELLAALKLDFDDGVMLDPFCGAGSTLLAAALLGRPAVGVDRNQTRVAACELKGLAPLLADLVDQRGWPEVQATSGWQRARRLCDEIGGEIYGPALYERVVEDCRTLCVRWPAGSIRATRGDAAESPRYIAPSLGAVDVFCSPPHGTGRLPADDSDRQQALNALVASLGQLVCLGRLRRVVVEYECTSTISGSDQITECLAEASVDVEHRIVLYRSLPGDFVDVIEGGVISGRAGR